MPRPKFKIGDRVRANEKASGSYEEREGTVTDVTRAVRVPRLQYGVLFSSEQGKPDRGYFDSWMLDLAS